MKKIENSECLKSFGRFIRSRREAKGMLQTEVAQMVGITQAQYSAIENGDVRRRVTLTVAMRICQVVDLDISDFIKTYM